MFNNKGHGYIGSIVWILWLVLIASGLAWIGITGWIIFLIRLITKQ